MIHAQHELELLIRARHPFIAIHGADEVRIEAVLRGAARTLGLPLHVWSMTQGLRSSGALTPTHRGKTLEEALDVAKRASAEALYLFKDLQSWWDDATMLRHLLDLSRYFEMDRRTVFLAGPDIRVPPRLKHLCASWHLPLPTDEELRTLAQRVVKDFSGPVPVRVELDEGGLNKLVEGLKGMTAVEAERALCAAVADDLALTDGDVAEVLDLKRRVLREGGVLEYVVPDIDLDEVGGLETLKAWLARRRGAFGEEAKAFGLPPPKGVVLLGVQGCGKSLAAKAVAADWQIPMLRLEAGRIYDKFIGESDKNLEQALRAAEHMAPCVLLVDEIEKAFAYSGSADADGGLSRRLLGRLLGWLQDREAPVFVVATCNDVSQLPPELIRKGRFDEIFFVDLPDDAARRAILAIHLRMRERRPEDFDAEALAAATEGFSGAELEQAVVGALYAAFAAGTDLDTDLLLEEIRSTRPLSATRAEEIGRLRAWARERTVPAGRGA